MSRNITIDKTLWTEHSLEMLFKALRTNKSDSQLKKILFEFKGKGLTAGYLIRKVRETVGVQAARRLGGILRPQEGRPVVKRVKKRGGLFSWLGAFFKR